MVSILLHVVFFTKFHDGFKVIHRIRPYKNYKGT